MTTDSDLWLVRTAKNVVSGPFPREHVKGMIQEGQLTPVDEICCAGIYWITLNEANEVRQQLGIDLPRVKPDDDEEVTETETLDDLARQLKNPVPAAEELPELVENPDTIEENTSVLSNRALREFRPPKAEVKVEAPVASEPAESAPSALSSDVPAKPAPRVSAPSVPTPQLQVQPPISPQPPVTVKGAHGGVEPPSLWRGLAWGLLALTVVLVAFVFRVLRHRA